MIAILKQSASDEAVGHIVSWIEKKGLKTDVSRGENETIIGLVGDTTKIDPFLLESMDVVERVQRVSEPFKRANRKFHPEDSIIDCGHGVKIGGDQFQVIAGPCSARGENLIRIARRVKAAGATMLRGGAYKPRTSPYAYQGMGPAGLDLLCEASAELDMPIVTEIMDPRDVQVFLDKKIDVMQIGARNAQNFPLLKEVGKTKTPVLLKRGMSGTVDELLMAAEYIMSAAFAPSRPAPATPSTSTPCRCCTTCRTCPSSPTPATPPATPAMSSPWRSLRPPAEPTAWRSRSTTTRATLGPTALRPSRLTSSMTPCAASAPSARSSAKRPWSRPWVR